MKKWIIVILLLFMVAGGAFILADHPQGKIEKTERFNDSIEDFRYYAVNRAKVEGIDLLLNGQSLKNFSYDIRMDDHMKLLCPERFLEDIMGCSILRDARGNIQLERGKVKVLLTEGSRKASIDGETVDLETEVFYDPASKSLYLPMEQLLMTR